MRETRPGVFDIVLDGRRIDRVLDEVLDGGGVDEVLDQVAGDLRKFTTQFTCCFLGDDDCVRRNAKAFRSASVFVHEAVS